MSTFGQPMKPVNAPFTKITPGQPMEQSVNQLTAQRGQDMDYAAQMTAIKAQQQQSASAQASAERIAKMRIAADESSEKLRVMRENAMARMQFANGRYATMVADAQAEYQKAIAEGNDEYANIMAGRVEQAQSLLAQATTLGKSAGALHAWYQGLFTKDGESSILPGVIGNLGKTIKQRQQAIDGVLSNFIARLRVLRDRLEQPLEAPAPEGTVQAPDGEEKGLGQRAFEATNEFLTPPHLKARDRARAAEAAAPVVEDTSSQDLAVLMADLTIGMAGLESEPSAKSIHAGLVEKIRAVIDGGENAHEDLLTYIIDAGRTVEKLTNGATAADLYAGIRMGYDVLNQLQDLTEAAKSEVTEQMLGNGWKVQSGWFKGFEGSTEVFDRAAQAFSDFGSLKYIKPYGEKPEDGRFLDWSQKYWANDPAYETEQAMTKVFTTLANMDAFELYDMLKSGDIFISSPDGTQTPLQERLNEVINGDGVLRNAMLQGLEKLIQTELLRAGGGSGRWDEITRLRSDTGDLAEALGGLTGLDFADLYGGDDQLDWMDLEQSDLEDFLIAPTNARLDNKPYWLEETGTKKKAMDAATLKEQREKAARDFLMSESERVQQDLESLM